mgnify:CR=1 FL=1
MTNASNASVENDEIHNVDAPDATRSRHLDVNDINKLLVKIDGARDKEDARATIENYLVTRDTSKHKDGKGSASGH